MIRILAILCVLGGLASAALAPSALAGEETIATLRGATIGEAPDAPPMAKVMNKDLRRTRNYPEQPPTIPHKIDGYQVDLNSNKCMNCHSRVATGQSQAPMVSITHFMDRDGQFLASVSPRRYFCNQCHVVQTEARPLVANDFIDIDTLLAGEGQAEPQ
jgi:cytochrome c-type protein NapB